MWVTARRLTHPVYVTPALPASYVSLGELHQHPFYGRSRGPRFGQAHISHATVTGQDSPLLLTLFPLVIHQVFQYASYYAKLRRDACHQRHVRADKGGHCACACMRVHAFCRIWPGRIWTHVTGTKTRAPVHCPCRSPHQPKSPTTQSATCTPGVAVPALSTKVHRNGRTRGKSVASRSGNYLSTH